MTTSGRVLSEKMDVFRLSFYTAPVSCVALLPFVYLREVRSGGRHQWQAETGACHDLTLHPPWSLHFGCMVSLDRLEHEEG